jgi:photosystem II stability/assembly factor-like uncharacterized protein
MTALLFGLNNGIARIDLDSGQGQLTLQVPHVWSIAADRSRPGIVYAATWGDGVWRSEDDGRSWRCVQPHRDGYNFTRVAVTPSSASGAGTVYLGTEPSALFVSTDGGETISELGALQEIPSRSDWSYPPRPHTSHTWTIVIDPNDGQRIFVGIELGGIMSSFDGGHTWRDRQPVADRDCHTLRFHSAAPGRVYEVGGAWFAESDDYGATWTRNLDGIPDELRYFYSLAVDPGDPNTMVMTTSRDPFHGHFIADPAHAWSAAYRRSAGSDWQLVEGGFPASEGNAMGWFATDEHTSGRMYYTAPGGSIHRSDDGGLTWPELEWERPAELASLTVRALEVTEGPRL